VNGRDIASHHVFIKDHANLFYLLYINSLILFFLSFPGRIPKITGNTRESVVNTRQDTHVKIQDIDFYIINNVAI